MLDAVVMLLPVLKGLIERRVLVNYRVRAEVLQRALPSPFRVQRVGEFGIAGICLIRLTGVRPRLLPSVFGFASENAAHRVAVEWDADDGVRQGVFIPRRDTSSRFNALVGGRVFPGEHHRADFLVRDTGSEIAVTMRSRGGGASVVVEGQVGDRLPETSLFPSVEAASAFLERGAVGWSATSRPGCYDCLELSCSEWRVRPLAVHRVESSWLDDRARFPAGSVEFDSALLMRRIPHEWRAREPMRSARADAPKEVAG